MMEMTLDEQEKRNELEAQDHFFGQITHSLGLVLGNRDPLAPISILGPSWRN